MLAQKLIKWMGELGPYPNHKLLLVRDCRADPLEVPPDCFGAVHEMVVPDDAWNKWPESANWMMRKTGKFVEFSTKEPFLWVEPDCVPMCKGWLDAIANEYARCKLPFMGDKVDVDGVPLHMSGVGVYPGVISNHAGDIYFALEVAWDVYAKDKIIPRAHFTKLIKHNWKHEALKDKSELDNLRSQRPEMVLFHADKSHSIIPMLRAELSGNQGTRDAQPKDLISQRLGSMSEVGSGIDYPIRNDEQTSLRSHESGQNVTGPTTQSSPLTCDIFIKTWPPDYEWLEYCFRSIDKFATGFRTVHVASGSALTINGPYGGIVGRGYDIHIVGEQPDGYLWQQVIKLDADKYTDAEWIVYLDSDTIFTKPVTPDILRSLPWMMTPYSDKMGDAKSWQWVTERFLKRPVEFEFMRRHPFVVPRWLLKSIRDFCLLNHGMTLDAYVMTCPTRHFSEFNVLGAYAYYHHQDKFDWLNTETTPPDKWPVLYVNQQWSRGGLTSEIKKIFEETLGGAETSKSGMLPVQIRDVQADDVTVNGEPLGNQSPSKTLDGERLPAPETAVQTKGGAGEGHALPTSVPPTVFPTGMGDEISRLIPEAAPSVPEGHLVFSKGERYIFKDGQYIPVEPKPATTVPPVSDGVLIIDRIREHCDALLEIAEGRQCGFVAGTGRYQMILNELRKRKLAPRARSRK